MILEQQATFASGGQSHWEIQISTLDGNRRDQTVAIVACGLLYDARAVLWGHRALITDHRPDDGRLSMHCKSIDGQCFVLMSRTTLEALTPGSGSCGINHRCGRGNTVPQTLSSGCAASVAIVCHSTVVGLQDTSLHSLLGTVTVVRPAQRSGLGHGLCCMQAV